MPSKIPQSIIILIITVINFPLAQVFAESPLTFDLIPMHYGLLNGEPLTKNENKEITSFTLESEANKGATQLLLSGNHNLHPSELIVYQSVSGTYYVSQVKEVSANNISLMKPLEENINAGVNLWNFYSDSSHPNVYGFKALGDYALERLKTENLSNKTHAFIGDSWFDNDTLVPYLASKLNATTIINKSFGGRRAVDVLDAFDIDFPPSATVKPDYVWIILGTNDYWDETSRETYIDNMKKIIQKVNDLGAKAIVFTSSVAPFTLDSNNMVLSTYNELSHNYADDLLALYQDGKNKITAYGKDDNLVIEFSTAQAINNNSHYLFFIDSDNNTNTGYQSSSQWVDAGADYLFQDNFVYKSLSNSWEWGDKKPAESENAHKIIVAKNDLGLSNNATNAVIQVGLLILSDDWSTVENYYPKSEKMQEVIITTLVTQLKANKDVVAVSQGASITIDVLANDTGTGLNIGWYDNPVNGSIAVSNNQLIYTSNSGFSGVDSFWYEVVDSSGNRAWANVLVTVEDNTIKANNDTATIKLSGTVSIDVLANDSGNNLTLIDVDNTWTGNILIKGNALEYQSEGMYIGELVVWYGISDSSGDTDWASVTINITL